MTIGGAEGNQELDIIRWVDGDVRLFVVSTKRKRSTAAVVR